MITLAVPEFDVAYFSELARHVIEATANRPRCTASTPGSATASSSAALPDAPRPRHPRPPDARGAAWRTLRGVSHRHVGIDNVRAARGATEHLRPRGPQGTDRPRTAGYRQALAPAGPPFDAGWWWRWRPTTGGTARRWLPD